MRYKNHVRALILFCTISISTILSNGMAQTVRTASIKGRIVDAETGQPLSGANIVIAAPDIQTGTASARDGVFEISRLPAATYTITASFIGYETKVLSAIILSANQRRVLDIALRPVGIQANPITVTASKRPEKLLDAPAAVTVLDSRTINSRIAITPTEHLKALPSVDIIVAGLNQSRVVIRGFNDLLSGSLLSMIDYRVTRIPAVRLNAFQLIPTSNEDVERIEVVSGPASALYGPNSANGVLHVLTKSPFDSKGTTVSVGGGEQDMLLGAFRHAGSFGDKLGYKLSIQYYEGTDFEFIDTTEVKILEIERRSTTMPDTLRIGQRILDIKSTNFDGRIDYRPSSDLTLILNGGFSRGDNIEITDQGAAQALNAAFIYLQTRLLYKDLFVQTFMNRVSTDDTYFLRNGQSIINNSALFGIQAQHSLTLGEKQHFTYGLDVLLTRPDTEGTVNGRNEDHDDVNEIGAYLQSETTLSEKFRLTLAGRLDDHNRLSGLNFSPRAGLIFKPSSTDNFRVTFNRAFTTPTANHLFSDTIGSRVLTSSDPRLAALEPFIGETLYNIRALGSYPSGLTFNFGQDGRPQMITSFGDTLARAGFIPTADTYLPPDLNSVWPALRQVFIANAGEVLPEVLLNFINLEEIFPQQLSRQVPGVLKVINPQTLGFTNVDASFVRDLKPLVESSSTTLEVGYKGLLKNKVLASVDVYHTRIKNLIGPLQVETPGVFVDRKALAEVLATDIQAPALIRDILVNAIAQDARIDSLSFGMISPLEVRNGTDFILSWRNIGDVAVSGLDLSLTYYFNRNWNVTGNYSFVNRDFFRSEDGFSDVALNAPKHKVGAILNYDNPRTGLGGNFRLRFVDSFPAKSGIFVGTVDQYAVVDISTNYRLPFSNHTRLTLSVQNIMNNRHREFVGLPEIGRLALMRLTQTL